ncbi:hypothetical protein FRC09_013467, partial [Ceratobasidium sp. 395]
MAQRNTGKSRSFYPVPESDDEQPSPTILDEDDAPTFDRQPILIDDDYGGEEVDPHHEQWLHNSMVQAATHDNFVKSLTAPQITALAKHVVKLPPYAVRRGLYPGVYRNWPAAQRVVGDWMPTAKFGKDGNGSMRKFNCPMQAWRFISRDDWGGTSAFDNSNAITVLQSLPPPAGFTIPAPMIIASASGTLQHLEPPLPPPEVEAGEPLSLLNGDNDNFRRLPVGVCVGDARTHYHRVNGIIVLCSPKNRPKEIKVLPIETV